MCVRSTKKRERAPTKRNRAEDSDVLLTDVPNLKWQEH